MTLCSAFAPESCWSLPLRHRVPPHAMVQRKHRHPWVRSRCCPARSKSAGDAACVRCVCGDADRCMDDLRDEGVRAFPVDEIGAQHADQRGPCERRQVLVCFRKLRWYRLMII